MSVVLSRKANKFVPKSRWIASLSNGETIFEDHREGEEPAWARLKEYVEAHDLSITNLRAQFESGKTVPLPAGQEGYVQKKKAWITQGAGGVMLCIGYVQKNIAGVHEAANDGDSIFRIVRDPGEPWTIYRKDIREAKARL
jgi:hypothetical protein